MEWPVLEIFAGVEQVGDEGDAGDGGRWKWQQRTTQTQLTTKGVKRT